MIYKRSEDERERGNRSVHCSCMCMNGEQEGRPRRDNSPCFLVGLLVEHHHHHHQRVVYPDKHFWSHVWWNFYARLRRSYLMKNNKNRRARSSPSLALVASIASGRINGIQLDRSFLIGAPLQSDFEVLQIKSHLWPWRTSKLNPMLKHETRWSLGLVTVDRLCRWLSHWTCLAWHSNISSCQHRWSLGACDKDMNIQTQHSLRIQQTVGSQCHLRRRTMAEHQMNMPV